MDNSYKISLLELERDRWWNVARREIIFKLLQSLDKDCKILEIGCSGGFLINLLHEQGFSNAWGIDLSENAIDLCKRRSIDKVSVMDGRKISFSAEEFDILVASDILEHIQDDISALIEWNRIIKPGGKLIVFVPAFNFLCSEHDIKACHHRRYSQSRLIEILRKANFEIDRSSCWNFALFFPASLSIIFQLIFRREKSPKGKELCRVNPIINQLLIYLLKLENQLLIRGLNFPLGVSVFALARKR